MEDFLQSKDSCVMESMDGAETIGPFKKVGKPDKSDKSKLFEALENVIQNFLVEKESYYSRLEIEHDASLVRLQKYEEETDALKSELQIKSEEMKEVQQLLFKYAQQADQNKTSEKNLREGLEKTKKYLAGNEEKLRLLEIETANMTEKNSQLIKVVEERNDEIKSLKHVLLTPHASEKNQEYGRYCKNCHLVLNETKHEVIKLEFKTEPLEYPNGLGEYIEPALENIKEEVLEVKEELNPHPSGNAEDKEGNKQLRKIVLMKEILESTRSDWSTIIKKEEEVEPLTARLEASEPRNDELSLEDANKTGDGNAATSDLNNQDYHDPNKINAAQWKEKVLSLSVPPRCHMTMAEKQAIKDWTLRNLNSSSDEITLLATSLGLKEQTVSRLYHFHRKHYIKTNGNSQTAIKSGAVNRENMKKPLKINVMHSKDKKQLKGSPDQQQQKQKLVQQQQQQQRPKQVQEGSSVFLSKYNMLALTSYFKNKSSPSEEEIEYFVKCTKVPYDVTKKYLKIMPELQQNSE